MSAGLGIVGQRSRIASVSEVGPLRKGRGKENPPPDRAAMRSVSVLVLLVCLVGASLPMVFGPRFYSDRAADLVAFAVTAGHWLRAMLAAAFQSIPVW